MKRKAPLTFLFFLVLLGAQIILSFGIPLVWYLSITVNETLAAILLRFFQAADLLLLLMTLGAAFATVRRRRVGRAYLWLSLAVLTHFLGTFLSLIWQALFFRQAISAETLSLLLGNMIDSSVLPLFVSFLLAYYIFLKKAPDSVPTGYTDLRAAPVKATILTSSLLFLYRLLGQIIETAAFIKSHFGFFFLKTEEKVTIILDYIPILAVAIGGYFLMLLAYKIYLALDTQDAEPKKKTPS